MSNDEHSDSGKQKSNKSTSKEVEDKVFGDGFVPDPQLLEQQKLKQQVLQEAPQIVEEAPQASSTRTTLLVILILLLVLLVAITAGLYVFKDRALSTLSSFASAPKTQAQWISGEPAKQQFIRDWKDSKILSQTELLNFSEKYANLERKKNKLSYGEVGTEFKEEQQHLFGDLLAGNRTMGIETSADNVYAEANLPGTDRLTFTIAHKEDKLADDGIQTTQLSVNTRVHHNNLQFQLGLKRNDDNSFAEPSTLKIILSPYHVEPVFNEHHVSSAELSNNKPGDLRTINALVVIRHINIRIHADILAVSTVDELGNLVKSAAKGYKFSR